MKDFSEKNLDPCPWCREPPKVMRYTMTSRSFGAWDDEFGYVPADFEMVQISCCNGSFVDCDIDGAELMWNWMER